MALVCVVPACAFIPPAAADPQAAVQAIIDHMADAHPAQIPRNRGPSVHPPALTRPSIDIGCSPAQWSEFLSQWNRFVIGCDVTAAQLAPQCTACFSDALVNTADKAIANMGTLAIDALLTQVKTVAVKPVSVGILRAAAHSAKQAAGERFQQFATKVRGLMTDCDYVDPCPHAAAPLPGAVQAMACGVAGHQSSETSS